MELVETSYETLTTSDQLTEVLGRAAPRRRVWHAQQKMAIVQESCAAGASATQIARRYGISTGLLYTWRRQLLSAATDGFVPCEIIAEPPAGSATTPMPAAAISPTGTIELELPSGARLRISGAADAATLRLLLDRVAT